MENIRDRIDVLALFNGLLKDGFVQKVICVNVYEDVLWFNKERFQFFLWWVYVFMLLEINEKLSSTPEVMQKIVKELKKVIEDINFLSQSSGYRFEEFLLMLKNSLMKQNNLIII